MFWKFVVWVAIVEVLVCLVPFELTGIISLLHVWHLGAPGGRYERFRQPQPPNLEGGGYDLSRLLEGTGCVRLFAVYSRLFFGFLIASPT